MLNLIVKRISNHIRKASSHIPQGPGSLSKTPYRSQTNLLIESAELKRTECPTGIVSEK